DHVPPPNGSKPPYPDPVATDGSNFTFDRFGVRIPAIVISSWVTPGTVFRSNTSVPLDHTSVLATLRDWLGLSDAFNNMLSSPRI
ncbi:alkaline phosphatase family protein, partial [Pseudoxanthomonas sp. KAs_5_3]